MANNLNDHRFNLHNLCADELFNRFFRQTIYGFNRQRNISISEIDKGKPSSFNPENENLDRELTIIISGAQASFNTTNWYITIAVSVLGGILAYFVSGRALKS